MNVFKHDFASRLAVLILVKNLLLDFTGTVFVFYVWVEKLL